jgi:hypothetical protein
VGKKGEVMVRVFSEEELKEYHSLLWDILADSDRMNEFLEETLIRGMDDEITSDEDEERFDEEYDKAEDALVEQWMQAYLAGKFKPVEEEVK